MDVGDVICWRQLWDVGDGFGSFRHQNPLSFHIGFGHQHPKDATIRKSPTSTCHQHLCCPNTRTSGKLYPQIVGHNTSKYHWLLTVLFRIVFLMLNFKCQSRSPVAICGSVCGFKLIRYQNLIIRPNHFGRFRFYLYQNTVLSSYSPVPKKQIRIWAKGIRTMKTRKLSRSAPWKCSWSNSRRRYHFNLF